MAIDDYGIERRPEHSELPGGPRRKLVKDVRSVLWQYLRCRPQRLDRCWRLAWEWAGACARRDGIYLRRRLHWPSPNQIASQYLLLVLAEMKQMHALRLPFRAAECMPTSISEHLGGSLTQANSIPLIEHEGQE